MTGAPHSRSNATDIETLVERFIEELQTGESPTIEQYAVANPELAEEIRDLFPTILDVENTEPSQIIDKVCSGTRCRSYTATTQRLSHHSPDWTGWHGRCL